MSSHGSEPNKFIKYLYWIIIFAIAYEFLFSKTGIFPKNINLTNSVKNNTNKVSQVLTNKNVSNSTESDNSNILTGYFVKKIVDGDTVDVLKKGDSQNNQINNEVVRVRLLGINTPESVDPRRPVECFGKEASNYMKSLAYNKNVYLELDPSQDKYDKNGRLLAYVFLEGDNSNSNLNLNRKMIEDGYAYEYTYDRAYKYQKDFKNLQKLAKENNKGLWSMSTCNGIK